MKRLIMAVVFMSGCSSDVSIDDFPKEAATTVCAQSFKCCTASDLAGKDEATCKQQIEAALVLLVGSTKASVTAGREKYDGAKARKCLDEMGAMACAQWQTSAVASDTPPGSCAGVFQGLVADGGTCTSDTDCIGGTCSGGGSVLTSAQGTCKTPVALGGTCAEDDDCASGLYCDSAKKCAAERELGAACTFSDRCKDGYCSSSKCTAYPADTTTTTTIGGKCYVGCAGVRLSPLMAVLLGAGALSRRLRRKDAKPT